MAEQDAHPSHSPRLFTIVAVAMVILSFYFAKEILLPLSLAVLLSFVLTPAVRLLERLKLGRTTSVVLVSLLSFVMICGIAWVATSQVIQLSAKLPQYKSNLIEKIRTVRGTTSDKLDEAKKALEDIGDELSEEDNKAQKEKKNVMSASLGDGWFPWLEREPVSRDKKDNAVSVKVVEMPDSPLNQIRGWLGPLVAPLSTAGIVAVLVVFMLINREDLRNRLIRLFGTAHLHATTEAMDDATQRLSRYLRMQLLINTMYGVVAAAGLSLLGVPNALLWGVLGMLLRFLPYVGPWIAAAMPIMLSMAVSPGWNQPILTVSLFVALEMIVNNVIEPWLYGSSTGVSSIGVIVAAIFWTWMWGPIGLVLAMPMTVVLVVMGTHVPQLGFLKVLFGDQSALEPYEHLYQRFLVSGDLEAASIVEEHLASQNLTELYDALVVPALQLAEQDRHGGRLSARQEEEVLESARILIGDLESRARADACSAPELETDHEDEPVGNIANVESRGRILCMPVRDEADETAAIMLTQLLSAQGWDSFTGSRNMSAEDIKQAAEQREVDAVVLVVLPPLGLRRGRQMCKQLKQQRLDVPIVVSLLTGDQPQRRQHLLESGADLVAHSLSGTICEINQRFAKTDVGGEEASSVVTREPALDVKS